MPERSVVTRYEAKVDGYLADIAKMKMATADFAKSGAASMTKHKADWDKVSKAALIGGAAIGAVVVGAAKAYMDFEAAMSGVAAVADANAQQLEALSNAAIKAGQDTVFSASESAKAEAELAKAGVSVNDILQGGLIGSINLAAAGQIDLAKSAEISAQAMNIFKLEGKDVGHIADVLTAGANKSAAGVDDLGQALQQGGLVAKQTGLTLEETVGTLAAFSDNALKGSDAGTSLKTMLQRLTPQSAEAQAKFDELNISAYDAQGNFVGLASFAEQLKTQLSGLTPQARNSALAIMFGSDAVRGANVLYEQGAAGMQSYIAAVDDTGAAARMAARQMDNLKGDVEQLKGSLETAFIQGGKGGNAGLRSLVQSLTGAVNKFGELSPAAQGAIVKIAAATSAALLLAGAGIKATTSILAMKASMDAAEISGTRLATVLKGLGAAAVVGATAGLAIELGKIGPAAATADVGVRDLVASVGQLSGTGRLTGGIADLFREDNGIFGSDEKWVSSAEAVERFAIRAQNAFGEDFSSQARRIQDFGASGAKMEETVRKIDGALAELVRGGHADQAKAALDNLLAGITDPAVRAKTAAQFTAMQAALDETTVSAKGTAAAAEELGPPMLDSAKAAKQAADDTKSWADALNGLNSPMLDAREAARNFEEAVDNASTAVKKNGRTLKIGTAAGRENQAALDAVAKAANDQIGALQANGASQGELQKKLGTSRDRLQAVAEKFFGSKAAAKAYVDQVLKVPASKSTTVTFRTVNLSALRTAQSYLQSIRDKHVTLTVGTVRVGNTRVNAGQFAGGGEIAGPGSGTSDSIPALLSNGEHVLTAAEVAKAGGHDAIYRMRRGISSGALKFAQGGPVGPARFADGGAVDWSDILSILGDVTVWDDVAKARTSAASAATGVKSSRATLLSMRAAVNAANRAVAAARKTRGRGDDNAALDKRRVALARLAAAEDKYAAAVTKSKNAAKAALDAVHEYDADRRPLIDRTLAASARSNTKTKAFLDNVDKLTRMGFKTLALYLLDQGGPEAETLAAQAVKSAAKAKSLQSNLSSSSALADREAAIRAALGGTALDAIAINPLAAIRDLGPISRGAATGLSPVSTVSIRIDGALDPMSVGAQVEKVLQTYTHVTGRPLQVTTKGGVAA